MSTVIVQIGVEGFFELEVVKSDDIGSSFHPDFHYDVVVDGIVRHPKCSEEDVMRALGAYLMSFVHKAHKNK